LPARLRPIQSAVTATWLFATCLVAPTIWPLVGGQAAASLRATAPSDDSRVRNYASIGAAAIGMRPDEIESTYGRPYSTSQSGRRLYRLPYGGSLKVIFRDRHTTVLSGGRAWYLSTDARRYRLPNGLGVGSVVPARCLHRQCLWLGLRGELGSSRNQPSFHLNVRDPRGRRTVSLLVHGRGVAELEITCVGRGRVTAPATRINGTCP
jgi:hypothetical protein